MRLQLVVAILVIFWTEGIQPKSAGAESSLINNIDVVETSEQKRWADASAKTIEEYKSGCNLGYKLQDNKPVKFSSPFFGTTNKYSEVDCTWTFAGDKLCIPEIICPDLDLTNSDDCDDEYLEISDGLGGLEKYCGKKPFKRAIRPSFRKKKDLYVRFVSDGSGSGSGFQCEARCSKGKAKVLRPGEVMRRMEFRCVCGLQNKDDRIVGGEDAKMNEFPWQVAIVSTGTRAPICGGSIINSRYVLTAAHCFHFTKTKPSQIEVLFHARLLDMSVRGASKKAKFGEAGWMKASGWDEARKTDAQEKTQRFKVLKITNHPLFHEVEFDYDVSVLKLDRDIDLSHPDAPTPVCLPPVTNGPDYENKTSWVVGWGMSHELAGASTRALQKLAVPVISTAKCQSWTTNALTDRMLCAGYADGGKDACTGDSGGPLVLQEENKQWIQIGIVSWGEGCAKKHKPGIYSRVTELQQFIEYQSTGAKWCRSHKGSK